MTAINGSVSNIWTVPLPPAPQQETVVNNNVNAPIDQNIQSDPYNFLPGVPGAGTQIAVGAAAVAPITDGAPEYTATNPATGAPTDLGTYAGTLPAQLDPKVFENWTSMQQSEYLNYWTSVVNNPTLFGIGGVAGNNNPFGTAGLVAYKALVLAAYGSTPPTATQIVEDIGSLSGSTTPPITVVLSQTVPGQVYIVNELQKTDLASMSLADQQAVAATAYFQNTLATQLGLSTNVAGVTANINTEIAQIFGSNTTVVVNGNGTTTTTVTTMNPNGSTSTTTSTSTLGVTVLPPIQGNITQINTPTGPATIVGMPAADIQVFIDELNLLKKHVNNQGVVSSTDIATQVQAIDTRFQRAAAFWTQVTPKTTVIQPVGLTSGLVSEDGNATIANGYSTFITQEKQILAVEQDADSVATTGMIDKAQADVPMLVTYFQMDATTQEEATITADTTEVQQINALLQNYSDMQNLLNQTLKSFTASDTSTSVRTLSGSGVAAPLNVTPPPLTQQQITVACMFDGNQAIPGDLNLGIEPHPLELLFGIVRPLQDMFRNSTGDPMPGYTQTQWNAFGTQLSNTVTQLQQQSQILTDQINEETKQKDDHFSLANGAMSKMYDMVQEIGRNVAS